MNIDDAATADPEPVIDALATDATETGDTETDVEELLVEEVSIDGMCGVY